MVDSHAHIYLKDFDKDRSLVIKRAKQVGIKAIYMPNINLSTLSDMLRIENEYPAYCYSMLGLHPCAVGRDFKKQLVQLKAALSKHPFIAIGEIGLDLYHDKTFFKAQQEAFIIQSEWAKQNQLPVVIHSRQAMTKTIELLETCKTEHYRGVIHCFTGNLKEAKKVISLGFYLGIGGIATFKNEALSPILKHIDLKHFLLETDSPYLSPSPYRSKRNEPAHLIHIAQKIAQVKQLTTDAVIYQTTKNAERLFKLPKLYEVLKGL